MKLHRFFIDKPTLTVGDKLVIEKPLAHYMVNVLRLKLQRPVMLFNDSGMTFLGTIVEVTRHTLVIGVTEAYEESKESALKVHLVQSISKGERMDFTLQKSVELGVAEITPVFSERTEVRVKGERIDSKMTHWRKVIIAACEQCGRNRLPRLNTPMFLLEWLRTHPVSLGVIADPNATTTLHHLDIPNAVTLMVGPEGGFTLTEMHEAIQHQFIPIKMGPRILRTETAALAMMTLLQFRGGDL
jgi:16S rRNA (uracil1498-N3)-methyltransferase